MYLTQATWECDVEHDTWLHDFVKKKYDGMVNIPGLQSVLFLQKSPTKKGAYTLQAVWDSVDAFRDFNKEMHSGKPKSDKSDRPKLTKTMQQFDIL